MTVRIRFATRKYVSLADDEAIRVSRASLVVRPVDAFLRLDAHELVPSPEEIRRRDLAGERPICPVTVRFEKLPRLRAVAKADGIHFFAGLAGVEDGDYTLLVEPDAARTDWYPAVRHTVVVAKSEVVKVIDDKGDEHVLDPKLPLHEVQLQPKPSYPFPAAATLLRGFAFTAEADDSKKPLSGVAAKALFKQSVFTGMGLQNPAFEEKEAVLLATSDERGAFVFFFKRFVEDIGELRSGILKTVTDDNGIKTEQTIQLKVEAEGHPPIDKKLEIQLKPKWEDPADNLGQGEPGRRNDVLKEGEELRLEFGFV